MPAMQAAREATGEECEGEGEVFKVSVLFVTCRSTPVLEQPLPAVLNQLVSEYSQHMKQQTSTGDEIGKFSDSAMKKVQQETEAHRQVSHMRVVIRHDTCMVTCAW